MSLKFLLNPAEEDDCKAKWLAVNQEESWRSIRERPRSSTVNSSASTSRTSTSPQGRPLSSSTLSPLYNYTYGGHQSPSALSTCSDIPSWGNASLHSFEDDTMDWRNEVSNRLSMHTSGSRSVSSNSSAGLSPPLIQRPVTSDPGATRMRRSRRRFRRPRPIDDSSSETESVCYGMIHKVDVKFIGDLSTISKKLKQPPPSSNPSSSSSSASSKHKAFVVSEQPDHVLLSFPDGTPFGYLRSHMKDALTNLLDEAGFEFEAVGETRLLQDTVARARKTSGAVARVDLYVYGPRGLSPVIGDRLSAWKLWLQRPEAPRRSVAYENPHFLAF